MDIDKNTMRRPVLGSRNLKQTLGIMIGFFAIQLPLTILGWFRVTSQNLIISSITLLLIVLAVRSVSTIFDYTANDQTQKFKLIPCAIIMVLSQSFVSFWSLLMVGCSNHETFSMEPFLFATIQLGYTCIWCQLYFAVSQHVREILNSQRRMYSESLIYQGEPE